MSEHKEHFKHPSYPLGFGAVSLLVGLVAILMPGRDSTEGAGITAALGIPLWGLGIALLVLSALMFFWGIGHVIRRRRSRSLNTD